MEQTSDHIRACYDAVAREYATRFAGELAHKPLDWELLSRFAAEVRGRGDVYDLGCGPGQTTEFLHGCGVSVRGLDISTASSTTSRARSWSCSSGGWTRGRPWHRPTSTRSSTG